MLMKPGVDDTKITLQLLCPTERFHYLKLGHRTSCINFDGGLV